MSARTWLSVWQNVSRGVSVGKVQKQHAEDLDSTFASNLMVHFVSENNNIDFQVV